MGALDGTADDAEPGAEVDPRDASQAADASIDPDIVGRISSVPFRIDLDASRVAGTFQSVGRGGEGVVHYRAKGGHEGRTLPAGDIAEAFDPAEFVARFIMHIPEPRRHLVRYYGWYSNVSRGKRRKAEAENGEIGAAGAGPASRAARR